ncbi:SPOR domain-containing protein [Niveibacterium sp. 24ML]|uniref:SPOR domain-containing protein n=1 Tax=Niveibacterium sp. 24ML TaxID=2985512 RepID=UPI00226DDA65|nr:SPOR domain-containing protein [Niveibacterium sp. 24ML]MCX9155892.1 SPOR domain-containing protein [Niveibacterium sp. 24ML]
MKTLRPLFFFLVAANIVFGWLNLVGFNTAPGGEPERLSSQLHPEKLKVVGYGDDSAKPEQAAAAAEAAQSEPEPAPQAAASEPDPAAAASGAEAVPAPATKPLALACVSWSGLSKVQAEAISLRAKESNFKAREQTVTGTSSWWVHLPPQPDRASADKKAEELRGLGVSDYFIVKDAGANQNAISLGLYKSEESANRALESLKAKGVRSARIETREATSVKLEITGPADQLAGFSSDTSAKVPNAPRSSCPPAR